jgi:hypothetical protein
MKRSLLVSSYETGGRSSSESFGRIGPRTGWCMTWMPALRATGPTRPTPIADESSRYGHSVGVSGAWPSEGRWPAWVNAYPRPRDPPAGTT